MIDYLAIAKEAEARFNGEDGLSDAPVATRATGSAPTAAIELLLGLRLDQFAADGQPIEVRVPWWPTTHFFVPTARDVEALSRRGIGRERIWLPAELADILASGASNADIRGRTVVKLAVRTFDGEVTDVLRPPRWGEASEGLVL